MSGWDKYGALCMNEFSAIVETTSEDHKHEINESMIADIFDDEPIEVNRHSSPAERFIGRVFRGYIEIFKSRQSLADIEIYIRSFPFAKSGVSKSDYLGYHVTNYFAEVYILKERLISYLKKLNREFRSEACHAEIENQISPLYKIVAGALKHIVDIRGRHVHDLRYSNRDFERLSLLEVLAGPSAIDCEFREVLAPHYELEFRSIRNDWKRRLKSNNEVLDELLDLYGEHLFATLCDESKNRLKCPARFNAT